VVAKAPVLGGKAMTMHTKIKGLRKLGEADIEVKIKGQEIEKLFELARQSGEAINQLRQFTNVYVSTDMTKNVRLVIPERRIASRQDLDVCI